MLNERCDEVTSDAAVGRCIYGLFADEFDPKFDRDVFVPSDSEDSIPRCVYGDVFAEDFDPSVDVDVFEAAR